MSAESSAIEEAMEGQDSVGTEPVMGQAMQGESPLRTIIPAWNESTGKRYFAVRVWSVEERGRRETELRATMDGQGGAGG